MTSALRRFVVPGAALVLALSLTGCGAGSPVVLQPDSADRFAEAEQGLLDAGFAANASNSDASSAFGSSTGNGYNVQLTFATDTDGVVTAVYVVTNA